ncbi:hypothetical protein K435DRAFT_842005 [Dendrothele bispora CBS 962.96]|uniref:Uncharacterized protein n=1 Tax=Dendrothele bispora (strain CBS 962.96) TaxID=1314807 RepID=A0A4S8LIX5_DENBC|nr:hypothetical protein K435DRAFT_842005 [Dendrothele bispora CBS 962.96]
MSTLLPFHAANTNEIHDPATSDLVVLVRGLGLKTNIMHILQDMCSDSPQNLILPLIPIYDPSLPVFSLVVNFASNYQLLPSVGPFLIRSFAYSTNCTVAVITFEGEVKILTTSSKKLSQERLSTGQIATRTMSANKKTRGLITNCLYNARTSTCGAQMDSVLSYNSVVVTQPEQNGNVPAAPSMASEWEAGCLLGAWDEGGFACAWRSDGREDTVVEEAE